MNINKKFWNRKKVLITGHTGFKGSWLSIILHMLKCKIYGLALSPNRKLNFFELANLKKIFAEDIRHNICDLNFLKKKLKKIKPEIIFHLAAQSSVIESFKNSSETVLANIVGTSNILEAAKDIPSLKCIVIITTDKVYQNYEAQKYFDENSKLGGDDIYSGSKACCEIITNSYKKSFFENKKCNIATVRAGNCFGGGDWTPERIVKDILENFYENNDLVIRSPEATRPWQHVLEPLKGYLLLAQKLCSNQGKKFQSPWNFAPSLRQNLKVKHLVRIFKTKMNSKSKIIIRKKFDKHKDKKIKIFESKHLNINSSKVKKNLRWQPKLTISNAIDLTIEWYLTFRKKKDLFLLSKKQVLEYFKI